MKNIHVIQTDKPSRVYLIKSNNKLGITSNNPEFTENFGSGTQNQNIYITNLEEIKEGDWYLGFETNYSTEPKERWVLYNCVSTPNGDYSEKIILTTDKDLIKDGVQPIDDEFLDWFVKNPSCEKVEINKIYNDYGETDIFDLVCTSHSFKYKIIIPKEEPNIIDQWLEKNGNPEITKQVDEEAKKLQKQHLIDMMKQDEELGLYEQTKCYCGHTITCDCGPEQEILLEDVFNEEKKKGVKELIDKHKQETLEEAAEKYVKHFAPSVKSAREIGFIDGAKCQMDKQDNFAVGFAEWFTNEQSPYSITYGNQEVRFSDFRKEYTTKELLKIYKREKGL